MSEEQSSLIQHAKQGDQAALTELYQQTRNMAFFTAMRYVKNEADAADVMQNAYIAAFNRLDIFDETRSFEPWLRKIVVNQALNYLRGKRDISSTEDLAEEIVGDEDFIPANYLEEKEKRERILEIVGMLPDGQRLAITLFYFEGMAVAEIAEIMGIKPATAKSHLHFGRKAIKAAILEEERKGNKLYAVLPLPVLTQIFKMELEQAEIPAALSEQVFQAVTRAVAAFGGPAAPVSAGSAVKLLAAKTSVKAIAAVIAVGIVAGGVFLASGTNAPDVSEQEPAEIVQAQVEALPQEPDQEESAHEEPEPEVKPSFETKWADANLENVVREQFTLDDETIMSSELEEVTSLAFIGPNAVIVNDSAEYEYIHDIVSQDISITPTTKATIRRYGAITSYSVSGEGLDIPESSEMGTWNSFADLQNFPNLEKLTIAFQNLSDEDLDELAGLESLKSLDLTLTKFSDASFIRSLQQLDELTLSYCAIDDSAPVAELTGLTLLDVDGCGLTDLSVVEGMANLQVLWFNDNEITDLAPLASLNDLRIVGGNNNGVADLTPLAGKTELEELYLMFNQASDLSALSGCSKLREFNLDGNGITDISGLAGLEGLQIAYLQHNDIADITPLAGASELEILMMPHGRVSDLSPLQNLKGLKELNLGNNQVSDLSPLSELTELEMLRLYNNQISDLTPISGLVKLKDLNLGGNFITDLAPIAGMVDLIDLRVYSNQITDISVVANMSMLESLDVATNPVYDFSPALHVPNVTRSA